MATSELDTTPVEWKVVRENLVQLHCEDVSWEQATDKIPLDLVRYLLGDLVPHLSTLVFLRGNRCLFMIDWTKVPDSYAVWQYMLNNSFHKRTSMQVAHYHFTFMLSHVGPKYEDLVDLYCQAYLGEPHPSFRKEDVWVQGSLQPMEHTEMLYLPPTLPGSTPKKANIAKPQSRSDLPSLEEMGQQELVELVKQLLEERANRPTPLSNPNKDATVAGHTSMNQESKDMRTNLRTQFDSSATYYQMLELARIVESENFHENSGTEAKNTSNKGKSKVNVASVDNPTQQIQQMQQLQGAVKGLTKLLQNNQQQARLPQIPQFVPQTGQKGTQENVNTLSQATNGQGSTTPQRGRGGRGGYRGRGGRGRGGLILCYWCRDFLPKEQANYKVAQCPYQKQAKDDWWKNQLSTVQGNAQMVQPNTEEN